MNILPNADNAVIPFEKLTKYSLDFDKNPDKAEAFRLAMGYNKKNSDKLIENIYQNIQRFEAVSKGNNGYGDVYEIVMNMTGENRRSANVLTTWIIENGTDFPRLTNVYVTKKKVRGEAL